jgi:hypothetical protein
MKAVGFPFALVALGTLAGCDGGNVSRSPISTAPSPQAPAGQITVQSVIPASGATLPVEECQYYPSRLDLTFWEMCADHVTMTFTAVFERDVTNAVVTAGFYSGTQRCGLATSQTAPLSADTRGAFGAHVILLSDESTQLLCPLPAETTRMVVQLWEREHPATPLLSQELVHSYRFTRP